MVLLAKVPSVTEKAQSPRSTTSTAIVPVQRRNGPPPPPPIIKRASVRKLKSSSESESTTDTSSDEEEEESSSEEEESSGDSDDDSSEEGTTGSETETESEEESSKTDVTPRGRGKPPLPSPSGRLILGRNHSHSHNINSKRKQLPRPRHKRSKLGKAGGGDQGSENGKSPRHGKRRRRKRRPLTICVTHCRYDLVKSMSRKYGLVEVPEDTAWNVYWTDYSVSLERAVEMRRFQIVNHFPGMNEICRKDLLAKNLNRMKRIFPEEYNIYPMTWCLPTDNNELQAYSASRRGKTYICKPDMGCQGRGIFLVKNVKDVSPLGRIVCQIYIQKPFLIDHLKFDLRMYVLITSCDPLRVWVFEEGLARFATAKYRLPTHSNTENSYMHLTNYAVNKFSRDFSADEATGTKRKLTTVMKWLQDRSYDVATLKKEINDVIIKTIVSAQPTLKHNYKTCFPQHDICSACFEILGFDILIDHKLKPFVIEVNHSPSFHTDTVLDKQIKESLLEDTFAMLNFKVLDRSMIEREDRRRVQQRINNMLSEASSKLDMKKEAAKNGTDKKPVPVPSKHGETLEASGKDTKERRKEDYDELAFQWELDHCGRYSLIYPSDDSEKYDKYLLQNQVSLYQDTAASQARAALTKQKIEEYNVKKLIDEQKRVGGIGTNSTNSSVALSVINKDVKSSQSSSKEGLQPESAGKSVGTTESTAIVPARRVNVTRKPIRPLPSKTLPLPTNPPNGTKRGFTVCHIITKEESDRARGLIQRGLLIRSFGIELQVYQLLCKVGGLKKLEHEEFRRKHGYSLLNSGLNGSVSAAQIAGFNPNQIPNGFIQNQNTMGFNPNQNANNFRPAARTNSIVMPPPKLYMKMNQFPVEPVPPMAPSYAHSLANFSTARTPTVGIGNTAAQLAHNFGNFARRDRSTTSHSYRF